MCTVVRKLGAGKDAGREGRVAASKVYVCVQYALLMMPIAAAIEEKLPATALRGSYAKLLSSEAGKRSGACHQYISPSMLLINMTYALPSLHKGLPAFSWPLLLSIRS